MADQTQTPKELVPLPQKEEVAQDVHEINIALSRQGEPSQEVGTESSQEVQDGAPAAPHEAESIEQAVTTSPPQEGKVIEKLDAPITGAPPVPKAVEQVDQKANIASAEIIQPPDSSTAESQPASQPDTATTEGVEEARMVVLDPQAERRLEFDKVTGLRQEKVDKPSRATIQTLVKLNTFVNKVTATPDVRYPRDMKTIAFGELKTDVERLDAAEVADETKKVGEAEHPQAA